MGITYAEITLISNGYREKKRLLVDTGATFTWIHDATLRKLGVKSTGIRTFETIEGRRVNRPVGEVQIEYGGRQVHTIVVFSGPKEGEVLGVYALEGLAVEVDPGRKQLKPTKILKAY
jgi:predicted aspartyl protease